MKKVKIYGNKGEITYSLDKQRVQCHICGKFFKCLLSSLERINKDTFKKNLRKAQEVRLKWSIEKYNVMRRMLSVGITFKQIAFFFNYDSAEIASKQYFKRGLYAKEEKEKEVVTT